MRSKLKSVQPRDQTTNLRKSISLPDDLPKELLPIGLEVLRIHESVEFSAQSQFEQAKIWRGWNFILGAPAAAAAALAGSAILSSDSWSFVGVPGSVIGGLLALVAAGLTALLTTINASRRMNQSQSSGNAYLQLQTEARQLATIDLKSLSYKEARAALEGITTSRNELNKTADVPSRRAYRKVKKNLHIDGGQDYSVDAKKGEA
jgi:hypothetical protein